MKKLCVAGDLNIDTNVMIYDFPVTLDDTIFSPHQIFDHIGGAATNVAVGAKKILDEVFMCASIGNDYHAEKVVKDLDLMGVNVDFIRRDWEKTARSVILVDRHGNRRPICDPKDVMTYVYDEKTAARFLENADFLYTSTMSWTRHICRLAKEMKKTVFVDVQAIRYLDDYHHDYFRYADIIFFSIEKLSYDFYDIVKNIWYDFNVPVVVSTCGPHGAFISERDKKRVRKYPAIKTRDVVDTVGAGDSFVAGFIGNYINEDNLEDCLFKAQLFASYKIGERGSIYGFPDRDKLQDLYFAHISNKTVIEEKVLH